MGTGRQVSLGTLIAVCTVVAAGVVLGARGPRMFSPGPLASKERSGARLGGVASHAELAGKCSACHVPPWSNQTMEQRCLDCHTDIQKQIDGRLSIHGTMAEGTKCRTCHTEHRGAHAPITDFTTFDHDWCSFKLTGKHIGVDCRRCHTTEGYKGAPQSCVGCHAEPKVHKGQFGTNCASCHSTATWHVATMPGSAGKTFDHSRTAFPLTGKHAGVDCKSCHVNNTFKGTPTSCVSCHQEPKVHKGQFGTNCASCHSTATWHVASLPGGVNGSFDHSRTAFPLTGKHAGVDCKSCHINNTFKGTPTSCVSCHAEPRSHKGQFGTNCASCHSTAGWEGATFAHSFPVNHAKAQQKGGCAMCHNDKSNYKSYTCSNCHKHDLAKTAEKHRKFGIKDVSNCATCHPNGKKKKTAMGEGCPGDPLVAFLAAAQVAPSLPHLDFGAEMLVQQPVAVRRPLSQERKSSAADDWHREPVSVLRVFPAGVGDRGRPLEAGLHRYTRLPFPERETLSPLK